MTTNGSMRNIVRVDVDDPVRLRPVGEREREPEEERPDQDPQRPAAGEHREDDGDEARPADEGVLEDAGDGDREVGAAEARPSPRRTAPPTTAWTKTLTPAASSAPGASPAARMLSPACVRRSIHATSTVEAETEVDDERLREEAAVRLAPAADDGQVGEPRDRESCPPRRASAGSRRTRTRR